MSAPFIPSQRAVWAAGQPISELMARALENPKLISLAAGFVDQHTLPVEPTQKALDAILSDPIAARAALQYGDTPGYRPLREMLLTRMLPEGSDHRAPIENVIVTAGSNQLLHLVAECLLNPGDIVLCAAPTYLVFVGTVANVGGRTIGISSDDDGIVPAALEAALEQLSRRGELPRVKAIYVTPYFDNPGGITMPPERREQVVEIAKRWSQRTKIYVISDCAYRELRYAGDDIPSMLTLDEEGDTVIAAGTFSKPYSPGVRVGWGVLPEHLVQPICDLKGNIDFGSPNFSQHLMAKVLELGLFDDHVAHIRENYRVKLDAMLAALDEFLAPIDGVTWRRPEGGLYVWVTLPPQIDAGPAGALIDAAIRAGLLYVPGQYCFPAEGAPVEYNTMRLSFGVQSPENIRRGIQSLSKAIREALEH